MSHSFAPASATTKKVARNYPVVGTRLTWHSFVRRPNSRFKVTSRPTRRDAWQGMRHAALRFADEGCRFRAVTNDRIVVTRGTELVAVLGIEPCNLPDCVGCDILEQFR